MAHEHHHEHEHHEHEEGSLKEQIIKIAVTIVLLIAAVIVEKRCNFSTWQLLLVYLIPYLVIGWETLKEAAEGLIHGEAFNEHFLMAIATIGALCIGFLPRAETQFPEAVFVMLFFQVGELFEGYAEGKSRDSIAHLMDIRPDIANVERDGQTQSVDPQNVGIGETILVKPGEKVPLDGVVIEGSSSLNTVALTGETLPREVNVGDEVISGCINLSGVIRMRTTKTYGESTVSKIIELVEHATESKSKSEAFITKLPWRSSHLCFNHYPSHLSPFTFQFSILTFPLGSIAPSCSLSSPVPAPWSSAFRSLSLAALVALRAKASSSRGQTTWMCWPKSIPWSSTRPVL